MHPREVIRRACHALVTGCDPGLLVVEDADEILDLAKREGVAAIVGRLLTTGDSTRVTAETFAQNARYFQVLGELDARLSTDVIVLKGAALLQSAYRGRSSLRPLSDVDLLVRDLSSVQNTLRTMGFCTHSSSPPVWHRERLTLDVHESLVENRIRSRAQAFRFGETALWDAREPLGGDFVHLFVLSPIHHFLYLAVHALKHAHARLIWLVDLALLLPALDPDELVGVAAKTGCSRVLKYTLALLHRLLDVPVPPLAVRLNGLERRYLEAVMRREQPAVIGEIVMVFSVPTRLGQLQYLLELCFPQVEVLRRLYPSTPRWRLPFARLAHLARMAFGELSKWLHLIHGND